MNKSILTILLSIVIILSNIAQTDVLSEIPEHGEFIVSDLDNFWEAFDHMDEDSSAFHAYLGAGSDGLKHFIEGRIINADSLWSKVKERKNDYLKSRGFSFDKEEIIRHYKSLKALYPYAKFPPVYFVMGRFNSGGTSKDVGLIIGVEMLAEVDLPFLILHECIHYQQNRIPRNYNLLEQSIVEGSADFLATLITGQIGDTALYNYCEKNKESILQEFVREMNGDDYSNWLYNKSKDGRPGDIGYWVGYKISQALYDNAQDKKLAINRILNNTDYYALLQESELLKPYMMPKIVGLEPFENYATDVDYSLSELSILFNHSMTGSSFRPIREEGVLFPLEDIIGYDDSNKTFKLMIKLEPNTTYAFKVSGKGFINEYGYPIEDYEIRFTTKEE